MKTRVGVIGPEDVVKTLLQLGPEFSSLDLSPSCYNHEAEAPGLAKQIEDKVDVIVFTGPVPYYLAKQKTELHLPLLYVHPVGEQLMRVLFELSQCQEIDLTRVSTDTLSRIVVDEIYEGVGLSSNEVFTKHYNGPILAKELVAFHHSLWKEGKISAALTCLRTADIELRALGVRSYWITPVKSAMREALQLAVLEGIHLRSRAMQIVVGICNVDRFQDYVKRSNSEYEAQRMKLALHELLNDYGEQVQAWVQELGSDEFAIFMTRGMLEQSTEFFQVWPLFDMVRERLPLTISLGIGTGSTAREAGNNARTALILAKQYGGDCSFVVSQSGEALGPFARETKINFLLRTEDERLIQIAERAHLSVSTMSKLDSLMRALGRTTVTSADLARWLHISPRSARRMLFTLEKQGLAEAVGEEQPAVRGRPRTLYSLRLERNSRSSSKEAKHRGEGVGISTSRH